jgi:hypothetical protein
MIGIFGVGMAGLLMLNTTLQNQAFQARTLDRQATELAYTQSDLENRLDIASAPQELARRASLMGMRPNPFPALLVVPGGKVLGKAKPVTGAEVPSLIVKTDAQIAADKVAAQAKKEADAAKKAAAEKAKAEAAKRKAAADAAKRKAEAEAAKKAEAKKKADAKSAAKADAKDAKKNSAKKDSTEKSGTQKSTEGER